MLGERFFIGDKLEERAIELGDGTTEVLYFKQLSNTAFERYAIWSGSKDEDIAASAAARLVALGLCDSDGRPAVTVEQAERIRRPIMLRLVAALLDVNGYGRKVPDDAGKG